MKHPWKSNLSSFIFVQNRERFYILRFTSNQPEYVRTEELVVSRTKEHGRMTETIPRSSPQITLGPRPVKRSAGTY